MSDNLEQTGTEHNAFVRWKHTTFGRLTWAILAGAIAFVFTSLAINSGALWQYGVAVLFLFDCIYNLVRFVGKLINGKQDSTT